MSRHLLYTMCNERLLWIQWRGNVLYLELIWGTPINFAFLRWHQCSPRLVTVLLGTIWSSIKQIEASYVFDWENAIALDTVQGNRASSRRERKVSWVFSSCSRNLGYIIDVISRVLPVWLRNEKRQIRNMKQNSPYASCDKITLGNPFSTLENRLQ